MIEGQEQLALSTEEYWQIAVRRRWWALLPMFGCWLLVYAVSWLIPPTYRSETLILIEQQKVPEQYVVTNVSSDLQERLQSMTQQILSRTRLQHIIDSFHLYEKEKARSGPDSQVEEMRKDIKIELVEAPGKKGELTAFKIYYSAPDAKLAQQVTSQLTSLFIEENLQARQQQSESTTAFLESQLEQARTALEQQEAKVRDFKARYLGALPGQMESNIQILVGLQNRMQAANQSLNRAQQQEVYLRSVLDQYRSIQAAVGVSPDAPPALDKELEREKTLLADLQSRYTPNHPDIVALKSQIAGNEALKKKMEEELAKSKPDPGSDNMTAFAATNPREAGSVLQLKGQLQANRLETASYQKEIKSLEQQIAEYQGRLNTTPVREQQLGDLTRDYEQSRTNYQSLLAKKMQSQLATNLEKRQQGEQFRIIDPPSLPDTPFFPDHFKASLLGLALGIVLGILVAAGTEMVDARIRKEKDLQGIVTARVLVGIPLLTTPSEQHALTRRRWMEWGGAFGMVVVMAAGVVFAYFKG